MTRTRATVTRILRLLIAAAILWSLLRRVPLRAVVQVVREAHLVPLVSGLLLALGLHLLATERLRRLLAAQGARLWWKEVLQINLAALYYGIFLPAGNVTGWVVRFGRLLKRDRSWAAILLALLQDRLWATGSLALFGVACAVVAGGSSAWTFALGAVAAAATLALVLLTRPRDGLVDGRLGHVALRWVPERIRGAMRTLEDRPPEFGHERLAAFGFSMASQIAGLGAYYALARSLGLDVQVLALGWIRSATIVVTMIPVSVLGLGLREGALLLLLRPYVEQPARILAFSALVLGITVLAPALLGGVLEMLRLVAAASRRARQGRVDPGTG